MVLELEFIEVKRENLELINAIYDILKSSGEYLYNHKGLYHWRTPYPKESIRSNIENRKVFVVKDVDTEEYIHTFQLDIIKSEVGDAAEINKFATMPKLIGKGIGSKSVRFIEEFCIKNKIKKITLEVYDKSIDAVNFYKLKGFNITGEKETKHFTVLTMEKDLTQYKNTIKD